MIEKVECFMLECDNCETPYENSSGFSIFVDEKNAREDAADDDWLTGKDDKHYCPNCYKIDDNDNLVLIPLTPSI